MSSSNSSPCSENTVIRALDQPASLAGILIDINMIPALRAEQQQVLRFKESRNRLLDGDDTFRTLIPPPKINDEHLGKTIRPHESHLTFNTRWFRAMANALPWDNPPPTEVHHVSGTSSTVHN